ncbi:polysaccharide deacetylase family protein [Pseudobacillus sp. FSL P4-0506]|uniref:polysaccharide deacetylase family protein n=1 Tax=unclassified Pseudobacillus TaxID=2619284 RepID=UPI0030F6CFBA
MLKYMVFFCTLFIGCFSIVLSADAHMSSRQEYEKSGQAIWETATKKKVVAITFDDGPSPTYTPQILDVLAKHRAKATFFVTGKNANKYPNVLKRTVKEGHEVGNHTYTHIYDRSKSVKKLKREIDLTAQTVKKITGQETSLYRPVGGMYNDSIMTTAADKNHLVVMWSWHQDPKDWLRLPANKISNHVIKHLRSGDIILLHDAGGNRTQTIRALDKILDYLDKSGYQCVTVSDLIYQSKVLDHDTLPGDPSDDYFSHSLKNS